MFRNLFCKLFGCTEFEMKVRYSLYGIPSERFGCKACGK